jgi:hypothetical protein
MIQITDISREYGIGPKRSGSVLRMTSCKLSNFEEGNLHNLCTLYSSSNNCDTETANKTFYKKLL